jgi:hypothetical protein
MLLLSSIDHFGARMHPVKYLDAFALLYLPELRKR